MGLTAAQQLWARARIEDLVLRRGRAADAKDPDRILRCHVPGSRDEHGIFNGTIEQFVEYLRDHHYAGHRYGPQRHFVSNLIVRFVADDAAEAESLHIAEHRVRIDTGELDVEIGGRYLDRFRLVGDDWLLESRAVVYDWSRSWTATDPLRPPSE
jgi:hypothetical protein